MKKKIFESGIYPQGEYSIDRVKKIFGSIADNVKGIFVHTSKWKDKTPVQVAEFDNVTVEEVNGKAVAYADIHFDEFGQKCFDKGMFSGLSVELPNDSLSKIAILPMGTNPAITGAEFEQSNTFIIEFENNLTGGKTMTVEEVITALATFTLEDKIALRKTLNITSEWEQLEPAEKKVMFDKAKAEFAEKPKIKTYEEGKLEAAKEFEEVNRRDKEKAELLALTKGKVIPALVGIVEFAISKAVEVMIPHEFSKEEVIRPYDKFKKEFEAMPEWEGFAKETVAKTAFSAKEMTGEEIQTAVEKAVKLKYNR